MVRFLCEILMCGRVLRLQVDKRVLRARHAN